MAAGIGVFALAWLFIAIDLARFVQILEAANPVYLTVLPLAIATEQLVRAWKWRQFLMVLKPVATFRLFGAIMAGYLANILVPLGVSPFVRSWLIARLDEIRMSAVLATAAMDRLLDGLVYLLFVGIVLSFAVFPDPTGNLYLSFMVGAAGSFALIALLALAVIGHRRNMQQGRGWLLRLAGRLPGATARRVGALLYSFADGLVWPPSRWRGLGVVGASLLIKLIAATHFFWAGLAFGVVLAPIDYLFLMVFLGFLIISTRLARIPGGFVFGGIYALDLLGVGKEEALAMVVTVQVASLVTVVVIGALALWRNGLSLAHLRTRKEADDAQG